MNNTTVLTPKTTPIPNPVEAKRVLKAYRFTEDGLRIIKSISKKRGVGPVAVIEWALRDLAQKEGVPV